MWYDTADQKTVVLDGAFSTQNADGSFSHFILDQLWEARPPGFWVDFFYSGLETGDFYTRFNTVAEGVNAAPAGCILNLKPGFQAGAITISKPLRLEAYTGPVTFGD